MLYSNDQAPRIIVISPLLLLVIAGLLASDAAAQSRSDWYYMRRLDPMTDADASLIYTEEVLASRGRRPTVQLICSGEAPHLRIVADRYLTRDDSIPVRWRIDHHPPARVQWWRADSEGTGVWAPRDWTGLEAFMAQARTGSQLVVQVTDFRGTIHTLRFSLRGFGDAVQKLGCVHTR